MTVAAYEDDDRLWLQIELKNERSITLGIWKLDNERIVVLWRGDGEMPVPFEHCDIDVFRKFVEIATGAALDHPPSKKACLALDHHLQPPYGDNATGMDT